jgi:phenylpropionate dioxygenase-like ring-hydroxylating dioxygenase large terminal subunit
MTHTEAESDELERDLLRRVWFPVARIEDVEQGPVAGRILDTELVCYRVDGVTTVAQGRCPHRGMALWKGVTRDGRLECPYHGWLFEGGTGKCTEIPSLAEGGGLPNVALRTFPVTEAYGHVWSCLDDPYLPFPEMVGYDRPGWQYAFGDPADLACGMRQLTENFRDMAHFPFVHTGTMGPHVRRDVDGYEIKRDDWDLEWALTTDLGGTALDGHESLAGRQTLTYRVTLPMAAYVRTSFPDGGGRFVAQFATPINAERTRVRQFWVVGIDETVVGPYGISLPEMWQYEKDIFEEDYPIVENQAPAESPLDVHSQVHTRADKYSIVYRRTYQELLATFASDR